MSGTEITPRLTLAPLAWDGAKPGDCHGNVTELVRARGGEMCFGWALADFGPHRLSKRPEPAPLYRRLVNHVVWRDDQGVLWEVTPGRYIVNHAQTEFVPTEFIPDPQATFENVSGNLFGRHCRYLPLRPEGERVAALLDFAQRGDVHELAPSMQQAFRCLEQAGFQPREWKAETFGNRIGSIWLIAE